MTFNRILVMGWPGSGKTTMTRKLCAQYGYKHYSCDIEIDHEKKNPGAPIIYIPQDLGWSEGSQYVVDHWLTSLQRVVIEGNAIPRVLRKWAIANPGMEPPCDKIVWCRGTHRERKAGQAAMGKGHDTVLREILPWLIRYAKLETVD